MTVYMLLNLGVAVRLLLLPSPIVLAVPFVASLAVSLRLSVLIKPRFT